MTQNSISPGFAVLNYGNDSLLSRMTIPVVPVNPIPGTTDNLLACNDGIDRTLDQFATAFVPLLQPYFSDATSFSSMELWSKPLPSSDPIFIETVSVALDGINAGTIDKTLQAVMTHRSTNGGLHRLYLIGIVGEPDVRDIAPFDTTASQNLTSYMTGDTSPIVARDGGRLFSPLAFTTKTNDTLRKKFLGL